MELYRILSQFPFLSLPQLLILILLDFVLLWKVESYKYSQ